MTSAAGGVLAVALTAVAALPAAAGPGEERHSGTVVEVDPGAVVVEEIGPGRPGQVGNEVARHRVSVGPSTDIVQVLRTPGPAPDGWPGSFIESRASRGALTEGAFVTVTLRRDPEGLVAQKVMVLTPGEYQTQVPQPAPLIIR